MHKIVVEKSPNFDESENDFVSDVSDIVRSLESLCECTASISSDYKEIEINSELDENELKHLAKPLFSYHFDTVRFVSISKL